MTSQKAELKNIQNLSDIELYVRCKEFGKNARVWTRKFAGLLTEVYRRHLYKRRGFVSIYEFAAKLAGMSHETTDRILKLAERFADKPALLDLLQTGAQGWSKLQAVSFIATAATDKLWAQKVEKLNTRALETYIKELRKAQVGASEKHLPAHSNEKFSRLNSVHVDESENKISLAQARQSDELFGRRSSDSEAQKVLDTRPVQVNRSHANSLFDDGVDAENFRLDESKKISWNRLSFPISPDIELKLRNLKQKLEKEKRKTLSWNDVLAEMLKRMVVDESRVLTSIEAAVRGEGERNKREVNKGNGNEDLGKPVMRGTKKSVRVIRICPDCVKKRADDLEYYGYAERRIPVDSRHIVNERAQERCEFPGCTSPPQIYHHTRRFALRQNHDPEFIRYLCVAHERLAHSGLIENEDSAPAGWQVRPLAEPPYTADTDQRAKARIDELVEFRRRE